MTGPDRARSGWKLALIAVAVGLVVSCLGKKLKFNEQRLEQRCGVIRGTSIDAEQARCVAELAGVRSRKHCPVEVIDEPSAGDPVAFWVRQPCDRLGVAIADDGRIVAVELGDATARSAVH